jgi:Flp pilus assembly protein TadG
MITHSMTSALAVLASLWCRGRRFASNRRGSSAVEFALLLPLMLTMYFGNIVITDAISADRQVTLVASTVAQMTSQYTQVATADIQNILGNSSLSPPGGAASAALAPFPVSNATVTLSSVVIDASGNANVDWSATLNGTTRSGNVSSLIPSALKIACTSVIWGEATYNFTPMVGSAIWTSISGNRPMYDQIFLRPRQSTCVQYNGSCPTMPAGC